MTREALVIEKHKYIATKSCRGEHETNKNTKKKGLSETKLFKELKQKQLLEKKTIRIRGCKQQ